MMVATTTDQTKTKRARGEIKVILIFLVLQKSDGCG